MRQPYQDQNQDQVSLNENENGTPNELSPLIAIDSNPHFQSDPSPSHMPSSSSYIGIDANSSLDTIILPLSPKALSFDCYDVGWPLASAVDASV